MLNAVLSGVAAGAVGTAALNVATYVDVLVRGRPESQVPAEVAEKIAAGAGIDLGGGDGTPTSDDQQKQRQQTAQNRKSGLGALMGYGTGLGVGAAYGVIRLLACHGVIDGCTHWFR